MLPFADATRVLPSGGCWPKDPVRAVRVVVVGIFAEGVGEMSPARNENAVSALAAGAGDPPLADRVRALCLDGRPDYPQCRSR
jgi:hypothetical protein